MITIWSTIPSLSGASVDAYWVTFMVTCWGSERGPVAYFERDEQANQFLEYHSTHPMAPFPTPRAQLDLSPDERMLGQYVNQASDFSDRAFTMPSLTLTGSAANS